MNISLKKEELKEYVGRQLDFFFPDKYSFGGEDVGRAFDLALERVENCFVHINNPAYSDNCGKSFFSHLHSDQYAHFLYYFSNSLWNMSENKPICDKLINLNKMLNGFFFSYKGKLPDIFMFAHPVGAIVGNASYSDFLVISQNVTINTGVSNDKRLVPELGKGVFLAPGAKIIGTESIGNRVSVGVDAVVYNQKIEDDKVVERAPSGEIIVRDRIKNVCKAQECFNISIK